MIKETTVVEDGEKHYCLDCYEYDDDGEIQIKKK